MRVALVDPPAFTLPYDHALAVALAGNGIDVELVTSRFRFGPTPQPVGYRRTELFYPLSSRLFRRSRLRLPLRAAEHIAGLLRLRAVTADVLHLQWAPLPEFDVRLLPLDRPSVITAHDILPRRSAGKHDLWQRLYSRFARVIVHSENGRTRLIEEVGVDRKSVVVVPHPVFPGSPGANGDGRTLLFLGMIRPYKQLDHAVEAAQTVGARLLVVGDALMDVSAWRDVPDVEWRLGYANDEEIDRALGEATIALFPYREELDQSGALLRCLGGGLPVVAYDVGGLAEPVRRYGAGLVVEPDDRTGLADAAKRLLSNADELEGAREGARRAAAELTWEAAAVAHIEVYDAIMGS